MCHSTTALSHIWALGEYHGTLGKLVHAMKFEGARSAADALAEGFDLVLPPLPVQTVVVPLPTAPPRVRQRGYDQSVLLARAIARRRHLPYARLLSRRHNLRQVGATREQRLHQARSAYRVINPKDTPRTILLVDDVLTTGASLGVAAKLLRHAGCQKVMGTVVARHTS